MFFNTPVKENNYQRIRKCQKILFKQLLQTEYKKGSISALSYQDIRKRSID